MNERLKQLMIQCEKKYCQDHDDYFYDMEKFAELIVKRMIDNVECHADMYDTPDIKFACERIVNSIKFDFGVEE